MYRTFRYGTIFDIDSDGVEHSLDVFPGNSSKSVDTDQGGVGYIVDEDDDGSFNEMFINEPVITGIRNVIAQPVSFIYS